jgi:hypothetical protein
MNIDDKGHRAASVQIVTTEFADCANFDFSEFRADLKNGFPHISIGASEFSEKGLSLHINTGRHEISGELVFGKLNKPKYDIMGPFSLLPIMECRHSVFSMLHSVNGSIIIDGKTYDFSRSVGYIEGDRGRSFPKEYLWTQYIADNVSIMLSVADIPMLGAHFTGIVGAILIGGREYRIATYLGARVESLKSKKVVIRQGLYSFSAEMLGKSALPLYAPVNGSMVRFIHENISSTARFKFKRDSDVLLDIETCRAGFEYEYGK